MINDLKAERNSGNFWRKGQIVKVGFCKLIVEGVRAVKDGMPDIYDLVSLDGTKKYEFIPHNGLHRVA